MTTTTLNATGAGSMQLMNPALNYMDYIYVGEFNNYVGNILHGAVQFSALNTGTIPANAIVSSAILKLYALIDYADNAGTIEVYRFKLAFNEAQICWTNRKAGVPWNTAGCGNALDRDTVNIGTLATASNEALNAYKSITLSAIKVQEMIKGTVNNYGFMLKTTSENNDGYGYSVDGAANPPQLVVTYSTFKATTVLFFKNFELPWQKDNRLWQPNKSGLITI